MFENIKVLLIQGWKWAKCFIMSILIIIKIVVEKDNILILLVFVCDFIYSMNFSYQWHTKSDSDLIGGTLCDLATLNGAAYLCESVNRFDAITRPHMSAPLS